MTSKMDVKPKVEAIETEDVSIDIPDFVNPNKIEVKEQYSCNTCSENFNHPLSLKIHEMLHDEKLYCFVCKRNFQEKHFQDHIRRVHMNLVCPLCSRVYVLKNILSRHMNTHTKEIVYKCDKCDKSYLYPASLRSHQTHVHNNLKHVCDKCSSTFNSSTALNRHWKNKHTYKEAMYCRICFKDFTDRQLRNLHEHYHVKNKQCEECGSKYDFGNLTKHLTSHYCMEKCIHCQKLVHKSLLDIHVKAVHGSYICSVCEMVFRDNYKYIQHCKSHEDKLVTYRIPSLTEQTLKMHKKNDAIYTCKICFKTFKKWLNLRKHYINHNIYRPFECDQCLKRFKHAEVLKRHIASLHAEMKFKCDKCFRKYRLESHLLKHSCNGGKYSCIVCEIKFLDKSNLNKHQRNLHSPRTDSYINQSYNRLTEHVEVNPMTDVNIKAGNGKKYQCKKCHSTFCILGNFKRHFCQEINRKKLDQHESWLKRSKHNPLKNIDLECNLCGLVCKTKSGLKLHYKKHVLNKSEGEKEPENEDLFNKTMECEGSSEADDSEEKLSHNPIRNEDALLEDAACSKIEGNISNVTVKYEDILTGDDVCAKTEYIYVKTEIGDALTKDDGCSETNDGGKKIKYEDDDIMEEFTAWKNEDLDIIEDSKVGEEDSDY